MKQGSFSNVEDRLVGGLARWRAFAICVLTVLVGEGVIDLAWGSGFREFRPIMTSAFGQKDQGYGGAASVRKARPVSRKLVKAAVKKVVAAWNANDIGSVLSDDFFDKSRLGDTMAIRVPRDARLDVLAIRSMQTLEQHRDSGREGVMISTVSVTVRTQVTYNDPVGGYQRREGENEYILRIRHLAP